MEKQAMPIDELLPHGISNQLELVSRKTRQENSVINISGVTIGGPEIVIIAGPCSVETKEQLFNSAHVAKMNGATILRGGAYKPRTSPYSFQGLKEEGIKLLSQVRREYNIPVVTEVMDTRKLKFIADNVDMLQIGSRNMHNTALLEEAGKSGVPVLLKRGMSATIEEFLFAAEYILKQGNSQVVLCERGIRTFEPSTRFTLDISAIPMIKRISHLPVIVDPSHGTGHWWMVPELAKAALAAGADGLIIEVHYDPNRALCDGSQSLNPDTFETLMNDLVQIGHAVGREIFSTVGREVHV
jgi:3-deoxy-7-phosphoheptulonate synthase